jgi:apolipoprotein N-acyltransferase
MVLSKPVTIISGILISGLCWYLSCGLSGDYWWLLWIAPVPVLLISLQLKPRQAFVVALLAYLAGRLNLVPYLLSVVPASIVIIYTLLLSIIFGLIVVISRKIILHSPHWTSVLVFPTCCVAFEFLFFLLSRDGTFGSIAYSQSNFLPLIQVASLTGITGISFLVCLFPSAVVVSIYYRKNKKTRNHSLIITASLLAAVFLFGLIRLSRPSATKEIAVGMTVIDEKLHFEANNNKTENEIRILALYEPGIAALAKQGAEVVVLPEKIITLTKNNIDSLTRLLKDIAIRQHIVLVIGCTRDKKADKDNIALVISSSGEILNDYQKVNLFEGESYEGFVPGKNIGMFSLDNIPSGIAICKDMDFQQYLRKYGQDARILFVPAWDFVKDDWLHARMAILRGVENGYSIARNARIGRLTISDDRGRVLYEASCSNGRGASLLGKLPVAQNKTFFNVAGDWFNIACLLAAIYFISFHFFRKKILAK